MAQTTDAMSMRDGKLEYSLNGSSYDEISGEANSVAVSGGERQTGEAYTFEGDVAIITKGKRQPQDVSVNLIYTETAGNPYEDLRTAYEAGNNIWVRWSPAGGNSGDKTYTATGPITSCPPPVGESGSPDAVLITFVVRTPEVVDGVV